jgi:NAD(P)-dependent dehydrogenase (short-subunit alcohol dehydrogenase family)
MVVLISGASGGFGAVLGSTLASHGMTVYGTMRDPSGRERDFPFPVLPLEVTDSGSVAACIEALVAREGRIDAVVNCVNRMIIGSVEEQTVDEVRALYDINVFGVMRVCQQLIPLMRKQGGGTIVNMSSLGGLLAVPYMSAYTSAKFALEAFSEALYHEVKPAGIDVVIMQPVAMKLERPATGAHLELVENVAADSRSHAMLARMTSDKKPLRVPMDRAKALGVVKRLAPQAVIDRLIGGLLPDAD